MTWQLNNDISYCRLDERLVFLDIGKDRYFQLSETLERRFLDFAKGGSTAETDLSTLARYNILSKGPYPIDRIPSTVLPVPSRSVPEKAGVEAHASMPTILDASVSVLAMRRRLKWQRLKYILENLNQYRRERVMALPANRNRTDTESRVIEAAAVFNHVRPFIPITSRCLIDSLSLVEFLAKRGLHASLVIAVACDPFSAHAWAQHVDIVLNDTVGNTGAYVPIRVL